MNELSIQTRARDADPDLFWSAPWPLEQVRSAGAKYAALGRLARLAEGPPRSELLRAVARRWPGALREAELVGPVRVEARGSVVEGGGAGTRRSWLAGAPSAAGSPNTGDRAAVVLWAELHELLGDQLRFRREGPPDLPRDHHGFSRWLELQGGAAADVGLGQRWPAVLSPASLLGPRLRARAAYLWLAARAGLDLPALNRLLFARAGHWDERPGDPDWARSPAPVVG